MRSGVPLREWMQLREHAPRIVVRKRGSLDAAALGARSRRFAAATVPRLRGRVAFATRVAFEPPRASPALTAA
jgi:hypothetical protein